MKKKSIYADEIVVVAENQYGEELCTLIPDSMNYNYEMPTAICGYPFQPGDVIRIQAYDMDYNKVDPYDIEQ